MTSGFVSGLTLGKKIGNGHFGEVFHGVDPAHDAVAVKVLRREAYHDDATWPTFKAGYIAEAKNLSKAAHRNVVQVHHVAEAPDGNSVVICMAFCPGGSLQDAFEVGPMTLGAVRKTGTEMLMGLGALHARGMIHRDIKPANVLLGGRGEAQLSDFGFVTGDLVRGYASQAGYSDHIAYEVWNGRGTSVRSDIWAFGMTLYRLLHGKAWYEAMPDPRGSSATAGSRTLKWLPHVPKVWRRVLRKMLHDDADVRYQSTAQALSALSGLPVAPDWTVTVAGLDLVRWDRAKGTRRIVVEWRRHSPRRHEWRAWSEPVGTGRTKTLGSWGGIVPASQAVKGLEAFFAS